MCISKKNVKEKPLLLNKTLLNLHQNTSLLMVWSIYKQTFYWHCRVKLRDTETAKENTEERFSANTGVCPKKHEN